MADNKNGHWYTDENGNHYFVENGQSPKEGWESTHKRVLNGKHQIKVGDRDYEDIDFEEYNKYDADEDEFDENIDADFEAAVADEDFERSSNDDKEEQIDLLIQDKDVQNTSNEERLAEGGLKGHFERAGHKVSDVTDKSMIVDEKYKIVDVGNGGFDVYDGDKKIANAIGNQKDFVTLIDEYESRQGAFTSSKGNNPYPGNQATNEENNSYQAPHKYEDFEDARYYPVSDEDKKAAAPKEEKLKNTKGEWYNSNDGSVVYGKDGLAHGYIKHANGKYIPNYTYGGKWRNQDTENLQMFDNLDEAKSYVEKGLNRFSKKPSYEDYGIDKDLNEQLRDFEYYHDVEDVDNEIDKIKKWRDKALGQSYADEKYLGKFDRDIALLSNPKIRQYITDRNTFDKQFESDFEEFKEEAAKKYIEKILGENELYKYENRDDFGKDKDDLFDSINNDFAERYGYERKKYGDMFSPLRESHAFSNYYGEDEDYKDNTGNYRRRKLNKDKIIGDLLGSGRLTFAELKKMINR